MQEANLTPPSSTLWEGVCWELPKDLGEARTGWVGGGAVRAAPGSKGPSAHRCLNEPGQLEREAAQ